MWKITKLTDVLPCRFRIQTLTLLLPSLFLLLALDPRPYACSRQELCHWTIIKVRVFCFFFVFVFYLLFVLSQGFAKLFRVDLNLLSRLGRPGIFSPPACTRRLSANTPCEECIGSAISSDLWAQPLLVRVITLLIPHPQLRMKTLVLCSQKKASPTLLQV